LNVLTSLGENVRLRAVWPKDSLQITGLRQRRSAAAHETISYNHKECRYHSQKTLLTLRDYLVILPTDNTNKGIRMNMDRKTRQKYEARALVIKAMAHPTRLFIIDELAKGERCVCELRDMIGADISTVSKHLSVLKQAGIVEVEKRGLQVWYSLKVPCILNFFGCVQDVLKANVQLAKSVASK